MAALSLIIISFYVNYSMKFLVKSRFPTRVLQKYSRSGCCKNIVVFPVYTTHHTPLPNAPYHTFLPHTFTAHPQCTPVPYILSTHPSKHTPQRTSLLYTLSTHLHRTPLPHTRTPLAYPHRIPSVHILSAHPQHTPFQETAHTTLRHSAYRSRIVKNGSMY